MRTVDAKCGFDVTVMILTKNTPNTHCVLG